MMIDSGKQRSNLRNFLFKLGIKWAEITPFEMAMNSILRNFGKPDTLMIDPASLALFNKAKDLWEGKVDPEDQ
jgi:hypothetical protein